MFRLHPKVYLAAECAVAEDTVIFAQAIPGGGKINNVSIDLQLMSDQVSIGIGCFYGLHGYVVPVLDPDTPSIPDTMWDLQVPKDKPLTADSLDMDTGSVDTNPVFELGDVSVETIVKAATAPRQVFRRVKLFSGGSGMAAFNQDNYTCRHIDQFKFRIKSNIRVEAPSYLLVALSSPDTLATSSAWPVVNTDGEWMMFTYMAHTLRQAWMATVGLIEATAETPYIDALEFIADTIEWVHEKQGGLFGTTKWRVWGQGSIDMSVPGDIGNISLTGQPT